MKRTLLAGLLVAASTLLGVPAAQAAACSGSSGVTVVVQFPDGHTEVGCAPGDPSSGYAALTAAGFDYKNVLNSGFVCRINGQPSTDPCDRTPPASAYWAYFHAKPGGSWSYSTSGGGYNPKPGTVEGWRFGDGDEPTTPPPGSVAPTPKPSPTPTASASATRQPSTGTAPRPTSTASVAAPGAPGASTPSGTTTADPTSSGTPSPGATVPAGGTATSEPVAGTTLSPASAPEPAAAGSGGGISWVWGVGLLAVLGGVGGAVAIRRRA